MRTTKKQKMREKELRTFHDERKDDLSLWQDDPVSVKVGQGAGSIVFSIRFSPSELQDLRRQADARGLTLSEMIRRAAFEWGRGQRVNLEYIGGPGIMVIGWNTRGFSTTSIELRQPKELSGNPPFSTFKDLMFAPTSVGRLLSEQSKNALPG